LAVLQGVTRNRQERLWPGMSSGEVFRTGAGWWAPEDWGCWTKPGGGELRLRVKGPHGPLRGYFWLNGLREEGTDFSFTFGLTAASPLLQGHIGAGNRKWVSCEFRANDADSTLHIKLRSERHQDMAVITGGIDPRLTAIGICGFYLCEASDTAARENLSEAILLNEIDRLESI
jgi:hypothetical protein